VSKEDLLKDLESQFAVLVDAIDGLSDERMVETWFDGWSVRDIVAHITGWHHEMDGVLERIARGEKPVPEGTGYDDADAWNARFVDTWRHASPAAVVAELKASMRSFLAAAGEVPGDRFEEGRAAYRIVFGTGPNHYREHAPAIRKWRKREGI
jgi:uncharacterized protein (TIGR03083 family)